MTQSAAKTSRTRRRKPEQAAGMASGHAVQGAQRVFTERTLRVRVKDKHAAWLRELAREVNTVWNYCN